MNLIQKVYEIKIKLESGMHIGGGDTSIEIGGVDNKVIRDVVSNEPYIPGSSLKGKMRHLLEDYYEGDSEHTKQIDMLFGKAGNEKSDDPLFKQTRLQFVDLFLNEETKKTLDTTLGKRVFTVIKYENSIDRKTGTAKNPRPTERVPKDSIFEGKIILNVFKNLEDQEDTFIEVLNKGIELLNNSYLGGSGSRGYGKVKATIKAV